MMKAAHSPVHKGLALPVCLLYLWARRERSALVRLISLITPLLYIINVLKAGRPGELGGGRDIHMHCVGPADPQTRYLGPSRSSSDLNLIIIQFLRDIVSPQNLQLTEAPPVQP